MRQRMRQRMRHKSIATNFNIEKESGVDEFLPKKLHFLVRKRNQRKKKQFFLH